MTILLSGSERLYNFLLPSGLANDYLNFSLLLVYVGAGSDILCHLILDLVAMKPVVISMSGNILLRTYLQRVTEIPLIINYRGKEG